MNKCVKYIRYILVTLLYVFIGIFVYKFYIKYSFEKTGIVLKLKTIIMYIMLFILLLLTVLDLFSKKIKTRNDSKYNLVAIFAMIPALIIFTRILFDKTIITNMNNNIFSKEFLISEGHSFIEYNSLVVILSILLLVIYWIINYIKNTKK